MNDEWCDLCHDGMKSITVLYGKSEKEIGICNHCHSLYVECKEVGMKAIE